MATFKNKYNGTWYVQLRYTDFKGERKQTPKEGLQDQLRGAGLGA